MMPTRCIQGMKNCNVQYNIVLLLCLACLNVVYVTSFNAPRWRTNMMEHAAPLSPCRTQHNDIVSRSASHIVYTTEINIFIRGYVCV